jgi:hypothetical protein
MTGQQIRRGMFIGGTGGYPLTIRALTIMNMYQQDGSGGGCYIYDGAIVIFELCIFSDCSAGGDPFFLGQNWGGGALYVVDASTVNVYGTRFSGNYAGHNGDDINNDSGTVTIHDTCPSPYEVITPTQGKTQQSWLSVPVSSNTQKFYILCCFLLMIRVFTGHLWHHDRVWLLIHRLLCVYGFWVVRSFNEK